MSKNKQKIQRLTLAAFFVAIEVVMAYTPIGYIPVGALSITTMHLPVILAGVLCGPAFGAGMGFVFGLTSFLRATFNPGITSFVFTPFVSIGGISGNFWSLVICFGPRILLGFLSGVIFRVLYKHMKNKSLAACLTAAINTVLHTAGVLGGIYVFFGEEYAQALGKSLQAVGALLMATVSTNMVLEMILAAVVIPILYKALAPAAERMGMSSIAPKKAAAKA